MKFDPSAAGVLCAGAFVLLTALVLRFFSGPRAKFLPTEEYVALRLVGRDTVSADTRIYTFGLESPDQVLNLPIGQHLSLRADIAGEVVTRPYTPISHDGDLGVVRFLIKTYPPAPPRFPAGGKMSCHLDALKLGESILCRGPVGRIEYRGRGTFRIKQGASSFADRQVSRLGLIAGGTGLTPCYAVLAAMLRDPNDRTEIWLLVANQTVNDILLRGQLERLAAQHRDRLHVHFTVDRAPEDGNWSGSVGFVNAEMLEAHVPPPPAAADDRSTFICMCGPPPMITNALKPNLVQLGFDETNLFVF